MYDFVDMHCHLDFVDNPTELVSELKELNVAALIACVTPTDYFKAINTLKDFDNVEVGIGLHPWWIADKRINKDQLDILIENIDNCKVIGEIGLDFSRRCLSYDTQDLQLQAFSAICSKAAVSPTNHILTIHSIAAADKTLQILQDTNCINKCKCIYHWFSGSNKELADAIDAGIYFSVNEKTLSTKKWKEYAKVIPLDKILLETDMPATYGNAWTSTQELNSLTNTYNKLSSFNPKISKELLVRNSLEVLSHN